MIGVWELWGNVKKFEHRFGPEAPVCSAWTLLSHLFFSSVISINFQWIRREQPSLSRNYLFFFHLFGYLKFCNSPSNQSSSNPTPFPFIYPCTSAMALHCNSAGAFLQTHQLTARGAEVTLLAHHFLQLLLKVYESWCDAWLQIKSYSWNIASQRGFKINLQRSDIIQKCIPCFQVFFLSLFRV